MTNITIDLQYWTIILKKVSIKDNIRTKVPTISLKRIYNLPAGTTWKMQGSSWRPIEFLPQQVKVP